MDLVKSGAVTNRRKGIFRGKSSVSYVLGTKELMKWLDRNPLVEFQPEDVIMDPKTIGLNDRMTVLVPARKVTSREMWPFTRAKGNVTAGPGNVQELFMGAALSREGARSLPFPVATGKASRYRPVRRQVSLPVYEPRIPGYDRHGVRRAYLMGRTLRERAQTLIEIAHRTTGPNWSGRPSKRRCSMPTRSISPIRVFLS